LRFTGAADLSRAAMANMASLFRDHAKPGRLGAALLGRFARIRHRNTPDISARKIPFWPQTNKTARQPHRRVRAGDWLPSGKSPLSGNEAPGKICEFARAPQSLYLSHRNPEKIAAAMKITYYVEMLSSWCHWAEPTWLELKNRYAGRVDFQWKIALMNPGDFPVSRAQCDWFYQRSGTIMRSPTMLNSGWFEAELKGDYSAPNLVAEAAKDFGQADDRLRLALTHAAVREGRKIGRLDEAIAVAARATNVDAAKLRAGAESPQVQERVRASTEEFHALKITQRPAFLLEDPIGDRAVFSGLVGFAPLAATIDAMLADTAAYATHAAHFGPPPKV
jgi:predicted DsbA family dithiol-disulfide isomerase